MSRPASHSWQRSSQHEHATAEIVDGLTSTPRTLDPKFFYDETGSRLFDLITELQEYYPARTETAIMHARASEMATHIGPDAMVVEFGSGSSIKTRILLRHMDRPAAYVPIDISGKHLRAAARELTDAFPRLEVLPVCADYHRPLELPRPTRAVQRVVVYFPGSTIGNFHPPDAVAFLGRAARMSARVPAAREPGLLIGVDTVKDSTIIEAAYNDRAGITAAFNRNALAHVNELVGADFDPAAFRHIAYFNEAAGRVEMHLESKRAQVVTIGDHEISLRAGERIWTESSYKYRVDAFSGLAVEAGYRAGNVWTDDREYFSVHYLTRPR